MIQQHIEQIQNKLREASTLSDPVKAELLELLSSLHAEVNHLSETRMEDADSVTRFAAASAHEATRTEQKPELLKAALDGLNSSVAGLESTHPGLAQVVNRIAVTLSNMGI